MGQDYYKPANPESSDNALEISLDMVINCL